MVILRPHIRNTEYDAGRRRKSGPGVRARECNREGGLSRTRHESPKFARLASFPQSHRLSSMQVELSSAHAPCRGAPSTFVSKREPHSPCMKDFSRLAIQQLNPKPKTNHIAPTCYRLTREKNSWPGYSPSSAPPQKGSRLPDRFG